MYMLCNYSYLLKSKFLSANMGVLLIFFATYNNGIFMTIYDKALLHEWEFLLSISFSHYIQQWCYYLLWIFIIPITTK